ncbi:ABC transporter C family member 14 [Armadillidium vulgare]|nr:ABC transporter C family member 14 [Armadillidium vulgare]
MKCLNKGDLTKAGENGSSLSGGQKARVALARSIYQAKSVYLLDDVLSSVDAPVAKQIMNRCIFDFLSNKTVILVTHHIHLLKNMDSIIYMKNGRIFKQGTPDEIIPYALSHHEQFVLNSQPNSSSGAVPRSPLVKRKLRFREVAEEKRVPSREGTFIYKQESQPLETLANSDEDSPDTESRSFGELNSEVFTRTVSYMENCEGSHNASSYLGLDRQPMWSSVLPASDRFTSLATIWDYKCFSGESSGTQAMSQKVEGLDPVNKSFLVVYLILAAGHTLFTLLRAFIFAFSTIRAAAKIGFFDLNPIGRILNRFSTDVYTIDDSLPFQANIFLAQLFGIFDPGKSVSLKDLEDASTSGTNQRDTPQEEIQDLPELPDLEESFDETSSAFNNSDYVLVKFQQGKLKPYFYVGKVLSQIDDKVTVKFLRKAERGKQ